MKRCCRPRLPEAVGGERPAGRLGCDAPAAAQHVAGDGQFMGRGADVVAGVVQHQVLKMDEFAVYPQRGAGIGKMGAFEKARADG